VLRFIYHIALVTFAGAMRIAALFHAKARLAVQGRKNVLNGLAEWNAHKRKKAPLVWMHCASLGEFEQGRPVIEALRRERPDLQVAITFFSPSGYEVRKHTPVADYVCYLPFDTRGNARRFIEALHPDLAIVVKYEYWPNHFRELNNRGIPLFMVSAIFRENQRFFGWQRNFWKEVLTSVTHFFLQNDHSAELLASLGFRNASVTGDTRFDRVAAIADARQKLPVAEAFCEGHHILVVGSSYPEEDEIARQFLAQAGPTWKVILAPHYIDEGRVTALIDRFDDQVQRWTRFDPAVRTSRVLVADTIGQLASLYGYASLALIGGAYGKGLHNTLEAAAYGIPVAFGPRYQRFDEARALVDSGAACSGNPDEVLHTLLAWATDEDRRRRTGQAAGALVLRGKGAVSKCLELILSHL